MNYCRFVILGVALLLSAAASAMPIRQFDEMNLNDKGAYETLLVIGAKNALVAHGQTDQAQKLVALFKDSSASGGPVEFGKNLQKIRDLNAANAANPENKQPPYEVEQAFYLTLKDNGIIVPVSVLLTINKDFKPSSPPK